MIAKSIALRDVIRQHQPLRVNRVVLINITKVFNFTRCVLFHTHCVLHNSNAILGIFGCKIVMHQNASV